MEENAAGVAVRTFIAALDSVFVVTSSVQANVPHDTSPETRKRAPDIAQATVPRTASLEGPQAATRTAPPVRSIVAFRGTHNEAWKQPSIIAWNKTSVKAAPGVAPGPFTHRAFSKADIRPNGHLHKVLALRTDPNHPRPRPAEMSSVLVTSGRLRAVLFSRIPGIDISPDSANFTRRYKSSTTDPGEASLARPSRRLPAAPSTNSGAHDSRTETDWDVIVVGAGPAGATAARHAAIAGLRTLLLEAKRLPRSKPCAGAITPKTLSVLQFDLPDDLVASRISQVEFRTGYGSSLVSPEGDYGITTWRPLFDAFLVRKATAAGVELRENDVVTRLRSRDDGVEVSTKSGATYSGRVAIGADGFTGICGRFLNGAPRLERLGFAYEAQLRKQIASTEAPAVRAEVHLSSRTGGYGWMIEKKDCVSVGCGGNAGMTARFRPLFDELVRRACARYDLDLSTAPVKTTGSFLPVAGFRKRMAGQGVLLVGDAAGLIDPLTGEGVYYAVRSARLAAAAAVRHVRDAAKIRDTMEHYSRMCRRDFLRDLKVGFCLACCKYLVGRLGIHPCMRSTSACGRLMIALARGRTDYGNLVRQRAIELLLCTGRKRPGVTPTLRAPLTRVTK